LEVNGLLLLLTWTLFLLKLESSQTMICFGGKILHLGNQKKRGVAHGTKGGVYFCGKIGPLSPHYEEKWAHVAIFRQWVVLACHQQCTRILKLVLSFFSFNM
jgi:hypothetical protein